MSGRTWTHIDFTLLVVVALTGVIAYFIHTHQEASRVRQQLYLEQQKAEELARELREKEERRAHNDFLRQQRISDELYKKELADNARMERERESKALFEQIKKQEMMQREKWHANNEADQTRNLAFQIKAIEALKTQIAEAEKSIRQATDALPEASNEIKKYTSQVANRQQERLDCEAKMNLLNRINPRPSNYVMAADKWNKAIVAASISVGEAEQLLRASQARQQALVRQQEEARATIQRAQQRIDEMVERLTIPITPSAEKEPAVTPAP
jgi:hypothetical protein